MLNTAIIFFCLLFGISVSSSWAKVTLKTEEDHLELQHYEKEQKNNNVECSANFQPVGDHCILVDTTFSGPWQEMRDVCKALGGDLPNLKDANFLADINDFLIANKLNDVNYWVGSNDQLTEGSWSWVNDNSQVKMGTPLWGDLTDQIQQPTGGTSENCGGLLLVDHYFMHDAPCNESYFLLCEEIELIEDTAKNVTATGIPRNATNIYNVSAECPSPYEMVYGRCIFINTLAVASWYDQNIFCKSLGGHMVKVEDANFLGALSDRLTEEVVSRDYHIGGSDEQQEGDWQWHDGSQLRLGTPFWGDDGDEIQEPDGGAGQNCLTMFDEFHYRFGDYFCDRERYVICQMDI